jgi:hypothetical protein
LAYTGEGIERDGIGWGIRSPQLLFKELVIEGKSEVFAHLSLKETLRLINLDRLHKILSR